MEALKTLLAARKPKTGVSTWVSKKESMATQESQYREKEHIQLQQKEEKARQQIVALEEFYEQQ